MKRLILRHPDSESLLSDYEQNLRKGRAFVTQHMEFGEREPCELVILHPATAVELAFRAEAVWVGPTGVGLELLGFDAQAKERLAQFVHSHEVSNTDVFDSSDEEIGDDQSKLLGRAPRNVHERVRSLTIRERDELARRGSLPERTALERAFGGAVWECLLQNPQLSAPEVARIAKNGTLPKALVTNIVSNGAWLASAEVQRALLSNPRCTAQQLDRVLRALQPAELQRLAQLCPYRAEVRAAAVRLVGKA